MDNAFHTERLKHRLDADRLAMRAHKRHTGPRVGLRPRHGGRRVIEHANSDVVAVVNRVRDAREAAREERRVADEGKLLLIGLHDGESLSHGDSRTHAQARIDRIERLRVAERVASDIAAEHGRGLPQRALHRVEASPVGTPGAQYRRADRQGLVEGSRHFQGLAQRIGEAEEAGQTGDRIINVVFPAIARVSRQFAKHLVARMSAARAHGKLVLDHMVELLENDDAVQAAGELIGSRGGEGVRRPYLPEAVGWHLNALLPAKLLKPANGFADIRRRNAARSNSEARRQARIATLLLWVEAREGLVLHVILRDVDEALVDFPMALKGTAGEDDPAGTALEAFFGNRLGEGFVCHFEKRRCMADSRRRANDDGRPILLGKVKRGLHHREALLGRGGVEHRDLRERPETAGVLLRLRGDGARVVGNEEHAAALDSDVVQAHQRVGGNIQPNLLAGEQRACAAVRRAGKKLERRLLVRRPFHVNTVRLAGSMQLRDGLDQLRRRRPGVSRDNPHPRLEGGVGERFVAHQQFLRHSPA